MRLLKVTLVVLAAVVFNATSSFAAFPGIEKLADNKTSQSAGSSVSIQDLISSKNKTLKTYISSVQSMALGLEKTAAAFGIKNQVTDNLALINSLQAGNISDAGIAKARQASDAILGMIKQKMQSTTALDGNSQKLFSQGISGLVSNIQNLQNLISEAKGLLSTAQGALGTASLQDKMKIQDIVSTASVLSKNIPSDLKSGQGILSALTAFASSRNISIPQEAMNLLKVK